MLGDRAVWMSPALARASAAGVGTNKVSARRYWTRRILGVFNILLPDTTAVGWDGLRAEQQKSRSAEVLSGIVRGG